MTVPTQKSSLKQWEIDNVGRINKPTFKGLLWSFAGIAVVASLARIISRLKKQHTIFLDDVFVIFATICCIAETGLVWQASDRMYLFEAVNTYPGFIPPFDEILHLLELNKLIYAYLALAWTSIFSIKFSFLLFFKPLVLNVSVALKRFYWACVIVNFISWIFVVCEPFILCPYFGFKAVKCFPNTDFALNLGLSVVTITLDIGTDIMIVSIPLFLLRLSQTRIEEKARVASFLCLSTAMIIISIVRLAGGLHHSTRGVLEFSLIWTHLLLHIEAGVAILMACLVAFRTIFAQEISRMGRPEDSSLYKRIISRLKFASHGHSSASSDQRSRSTRVPQISESFMKPITMRSLRNFVNGSRTEQGMTTLGSMTDPTEDYHNFIRMETLSNSNVQV